VVKVTLKRPSTALIRIIRQAKCTGLYKPLAKVMQKPRFWPLQSR